MEPESIENFLEDKSLLVTGATGFIAKRETYRLVSKCVIQAQLLRSKHNYYERSALHSSARSQYNRLSRQYNRTVRVVKAYKPYTFFHGRFDDSNMQKLTSSLAETDKNLIAFDTKSIDWESYLTDIHIPGIFKYGIRAEKKTKK